MSALHVRDVPEEVLDALKRRAAAHHRSLQGELLSILSGAAREAPPPAPRRPLQLTMAVDASSELTWQREEIYGDDGR